MAPTPAPKEKRGEVHELKEDLNNQSRDVQKAALKKVIANMTVGRDVSNLFSDVVRLISTQNIDVKKLVYLYVIANAKVQQDRALHLAGIFCKDFQHESPLIRGLAIRTLSAIQIEKIADHLAAPLRDALRDQDPYVRKCAATAVAKMFTTNRQRAEDGGFLQHLQELLCDPNPAVVAAACCALNEIRESTDVEREALDLNNRSGSIAVNNLLNALGDQHGCNEWGQVYILDGLAAYEPDNADKAEFVCERILSRLSHANAAVVLSSVRIIMNYIERWCNRGTTNEDVVRTYCQKIAPPLVSLVSGGTEFEIRYIALRNITLILQRFPDLLTSQVKVFFVKYNDPIYIKLEKLEIMLILVNHINVREILSEFNEYAMEVDIEFVRKAVRAIGVTAIKIETAAEECVGVLTQLIKQKVNYVVQEAIIVTRDIFRKYPGRYESIIGLLCDALETLEDPGAKAAMIWIIGEYSDKIDNADELLEEFCESFDENEHIDVRLAILTAVVKLFLRRHDETQELLQRVLKAASESEVPDLRDRAYMYWRLLSADPQAANSVVLGAKESINAHEGTRMDTKLVAELFEHIGTLASVYHRPPESFLPSGTYHRSRRVELEEEDDLEEENIEHEDLGQELPQFEQQQYVNPTAYVPEQAAAAPYREPSPQHLQYHDPVAAAPAVQQPPPQQPPPQPAAGGLDDILGGPAPQAPAPQVDAEGPMQVAIPAANGAGVELQGRFVQGPDGQLYLETLVINNAAQPAGGFQMQLNLNAFGIALGGPMQSPESVPPGQRFSVRIPMSLQGQVKRQQGVPETVIQVALKHSLATSYGSLDMSMAKFVDCKAAPLGKQEWLDLWRRTEREIRVQVPDIAAHFHQQSVVDAALQSRGLHKIAQKSAEGGINNAYWCLKLLNGVDFLFELRYLDSTPNQYTISMRTPSEEFVDLMGSWLAQVLRGG
eukprot:TRINITY_DN3839_c1_g1_i1.p1 TRINITY_DN3839_c1_g1~~TRINITY_DN3839_c1_g1_i1.p1  ORF type:complete len:947 (+),score=428.11 TRINITY_DN3839_c1_g1_i1:115-2955(+)